MIFVDTNYFLRYLVDDGSPQHLETINFFEFHSKRKNLLTTSVVVFFEIFWTLTSHYQKSKQEAIGILQKLISKMAFIKFDSHEILANSLERAARGVISLEDCFHLEWARTKGVKDIASFDKKLTREWGR